MAEGSKWTPYLEKMGEQIKQLKPTALTEWGGQELTAIKGIKTSQITGGFNVYSAEKIEKIGLGSLALDEGNFPRPSGTLSVQYTRFLRVIVSVGVGKYVEYGRQDVERGLGQPEKLVHPRGEHVGAGV